MTKVTPEEVEDILGDPVTDNEPAPADSPLKAKIDQIVRCLRTDLATRKKEMESESDIWSDAYAIFGDLCSDVEFVIDNRIAELYEIAANADAEIRRLEAELRDLRTLSRCFVDEVSELIDESSGVYGLHLNGDGAPWDELLLGGRFERLISLDHLRDLSSPDHAAAQAQEVDRG